MWQANKLGSWCQAACRQSESENSFFFPNPVKSKLRCAAKELQWKEKEKKITSKTHSNHDCTHQGCPTLFSTHLHLHSLVRPCWLVGSKIRKSYTRSLFARIQRLRNKIGCKTTVVREENICTALTLSFSTSTLHYVRNARQEWPPGDAAFRKKERNKRKEKSFSLKNDTQKIFSFSIQCKFQWVGESSLSLIADQCQRLFPMGESNPFNHVTRVLIYKSHTKKTFQFILKAVQH